MDEMHQRALEAIVKESRCLARLAGAAAFEQIRVQLQRVANDAHALLVAAAREPAGYPLPSTDVIPFASRRNRQSRPSSGRG